MGALTPAISTITNSINTVSGLVSAGTGLAGQIDSLTSGETGRGENLRAQQDLALRHLRQQQKEQTSRLSEKTVLEQETLAAGAQEKERQRQAALRRAMARKKVLLGGSGLSSADSGSAQAVLLGLFDESDEEKKARERLDNLREQSLAQNMGQQKRLNVLQLNQLKERHRFEREMLG